MYTLAVKSAAGDVLPLTQNKNYQVLDVQGLNPPPAEISLTNLAGMDGSKKNTAKISKRNIVIYIELLPPVETNRLILYDYFRTGQDCEIYFANASRNVFIGGTVETIECGQFTNNEVAQISIICPQPYFKDVDYFIEEISAVKALFSFPFCIAEEGVAMSDINTNRITTVTNLGDVEIGCLITIKATSAINAPVIWNAVTQEFFGVDLWLYAGYTVEISTVKGNRFLRYRESDSSAWINGINYKKAGSTWLQLPAGDTTFTITATSNVQNATVELTGNSLYQGV